MATRSRQPGQVEAPRPLHTNTQQTLSQTVKCTPGPKATCRDHLLKGPGSDPALLKAAGRPCLTASSGELLTASILSLATLPPHPELLQASWLLTPSPWLTGPDVLLSGYPLTFLLSLVLIWSWQLIPLGYSFWPSFYFSSMQLLRTSHWPAPFPHFPPNYTSVSLHMLVHLLECLFLCHLKQGLLTAVLPISTTKWDPTRGDAW